MMWLQGQRSFVIQDRPSKVARAEVSIAEIVKYVCAPLACANQRLVARDRFLKMTLGKLLVCLWEVGVGLRLQHRRSRERTKNECNQGDAAFHFKFSINSSTSRRFSGEIVAGPLCTPLYCHSSLCSKRRRS